MVALVIVFAALQSTPDNFSEVRSELQQGVTELTAPGALPGRMLADGKNSFVFLTSSESGNPVPLAIGAMIGSGRCIAIGHGAFCDRANSTNPGNRLLAENEIRWLSGKPLGQAKVGILGRSGISDLAILDSFQAKTVSRASLQSELGSFDLIVMDQGQLDNDPVDQVAVMKFVKDGHGLLVNGPAWGWQQLNPKKNLRTDLGVNQMLLPYGIGFSGETAGGKYSVDHAADPNLTTSGALIGLSKPDSSRLELREATESIEAALTLNQGDDPSLVAKIEAGASLEGTSLGPSPEHPYTFKTPYSRLKARLDYEQSLRTAPEKMVAAPSSATFPGSVPSSVSRVSKVLSIDCKVPEWHSTGLYAAPGEAVEVQISDSAARAGLGVRIGSHTDQLWQLAKWERFPAISRYWPLSAPTTNVANPFGGLIYIVVPEKSLAGFQSVKISGAVKAPLFVKGRTTVRQWTEMLSTSGSPWAEIQGNLMTLTVPISSAKVATDPDSLVKFWDEELSDCYSFYAASKRPRQERYLPDQQISAGYMHSGYPIMTWLDVANTFCDLTKLRAKGGPTWGFYHEMGHNFQQSDWTFSGTGEVTNNLFSLYGSEQLNGVTPDTYELAHKAMAFSTRQARLAKYLAGGAQFQEWTKDPFLALTMYAQLRIEFGWKPFTAVFAEYEKLGPSERPKTDLEKHDQWMVRFSRQVGKNLGPFFLRWGIPTTDAARASIQNLPEWAGNQWPTS